MGMHYIIDIDGTLMDGQTPLQGSVELIGALRERRVPFLLMTNSIRSVSMQSERLRSAGMDVPDDRIINPIIAMNRFMRSQGIHRVRIVGTEAEIAQVEAVPVNEEPEMTILLDLERGDPAISLLQTILEDLEAGVPVVTASRSTYYLKEGRKTIDTGAYVHMLEQISGMTIKNFGKPSQEFFTMAGDLLGAAPDHVCVIGDDWSTDIMGAGGWGARSILVRTGKYRCADESRVRPTIVIDRLSHIQDRLEMVWR